MNSPERTASQATGRNAQQTDDREPFLHGALNPSSLREGTNRGSFALAPDVGGARAFSSPDTPGMPAPSVRTAWDFLPPDWRVESAPDHASGCAGHSLGHLGTFVRCVPPSGFTVVTQLEHARTGTITKQMRRVAEREPHLTPEQVRDEVAAGRMVIPANIEHLRHRLDPMAIGRASRTKINANMGASPISSGTDEEVEKLRWA
ncbi:MAG: hypothetical protein FJ256_08775, partial [Phycisphaerae bacterium]|nr:hypothetical protein [Phycisphaerae bacterium]